MTTTIASSKSKVDELFKHVKTLPTLPPVVQKILSSMNDPNVGARQLAQIIMTDQTLATRVLKLVNSSFFGLRGKIQSIGEAVSLLGFSTIRQILLGVSICNKFTKRDASSGLSGEQFWTHSLASAIIARHICKASTKIEPDICYTAGLIHDIGKLLLLEYHEQAFMSAVSAARAKSMPLTDAERSIIQVDHAEVGNWLLHQWNIPRDARRAVKNHHAADPDRITPVSEDALTAVTLFANQLAHQLGLGDSGNPATALDADKFKRFFGKSPDEIGIEQVQLVEEVRLQLEILGIAGDAAAGA